MATVRNVWGNELRAIVVKAMLEALNYRVSETEVSDDTIAELFFKIQPKVVPAQKHKKFWQWDGVSKWLIRDLRAHQTSPATLEMQLQELRKQAEEDGRVYNSAHRQTARTLMAHETMIKELIKQVKELQTKFTQLHQEVTGHPKGGRQTIVPLPEDTVQTDKPTVALVGYTPLRHDAMVRKFSGRAKIIAIDQVSQLLQMPPEELKKLHVIGESNTTPDSLPVEVFECLTNSGIDVVRATRRDLERAITDCLGG